MGGKIFINIETTELLPQAALDFVNDPAHGAADMFVGMVRNHNLGREVNAVSYDVFDPLALKTFERLCGNAHARFGHNIHIYLSHFKGKLGIGGISVIIAVSSPHRDESFRACRFLIEELKHHAPIWKQEHYTDGSSGWVKGHALCGHSHNHEYAG